MVAMLRRFGVPVLVGSQVAVVLLAAQLGSTELALPGGQPTPVVLALLVVGAVIASAPVAVELGDVERQTRRGGMQIRVAVLAASTVLLLLNLSLVLVAQLDAATVVSWTCSLWAIGLVTGRLVGAASWLLVAAPGLVGFLLAGQIGDDGDRWFLVALHGDVALAVGLGLAVLAAVLLVADVRRR